MLIICEGNCIFKGYNSSNQKVICECNYKKHLELETIDSIESKDEHKY